MTCTVYFYIKEYPVKMQPNLNNTIFCVCFNEHFGWCVRSFLIGYVEIEAFTRYRNKWNYFKWFYVSIMPLCVCSPYLQTPLIWIAYRNDGKCTSACWWVYTVCLGFEGITCGPVGCSSRQPNSNLFTLKL